MSEPVSTTCVCEANLRQLRMAWNGQPNPDLSDIKKRLDKIRMDHFNHDPSAFEQFLTQYGALSDRLKVEQANSADFVATSVVKKSTGARIVSASSSSPARSPQVPVVKNPSAPPALKPQFTRQPTQIVQGPRPSSSPVQPRSDFQIPAKTPPQSSPQPSPDPSKKQRDITSKHLI